MAYANFITALAVALLAGLVAAVESWLCRPLPRVFMLGDRGGCNGCDAVTLPLKRHTNGGYYCPRCHAEIAS